MSKITTRNKQIVLGQAVNQTISLPVIELGPEKPVIGIIAGVHGNEPEGLFVIKEIVAQLTRLKGNLKCGLKLLPGANPFGLINNQREGGFDARDLNRSFPGKANGTLTQRIAAAIHEEFQNCQIVFDIHSVTNWGRFMGMELSTQDEELRVMTQDINRLLDPPVIWKAVEGNKYTNALDEALLRDGICGVGVEIPKMEFLTEDLMKKVVGGFLRIIDNPELRQVKKLRQPIPIVANAQRFYSNRGGLYTPAKELFTPVNKGDLVGYITDLKTLQEKPLTSKFNGLLFVQSTRKLLKTGDKIYVVVEEIGKFQ